MFSGSIDKGFNSRMANGVDNELVSRALWHDEIFHQLDFIGRIWSHEIVCHEQVGQQLG